MPNKLSYITTEQTNPYENLALEEYLLNAVEEDEVILYLWQNQNTIVIGKNQNSYQECKIAELERDGGRVARRLSGGGAVFHDLGNLNFTFLTRSKNYNIDRQLGVIIAALKKFSIISKKSGRNDITVDNMKFSGNAFYKSGDFCYHHGTLLLDVDMEKLAKYLNVSAEKLQSKAVASVKSRVVNLKTLNDKITAQGMKKALIASFGETYGLIPQPILPDRINRARVLELTKKYSDWNFIFGRAIKFSCNMKKRFDWGDIEFQLEMNMGKITAANVFSDAMDYEFIEKIPNKVIGAQFNSREIAEKIGEIPIENELSLKMASDIKNLILEELT